MHQELQRQYGLAGAWSAHQQRGARAWQTSAGDFIETCDAGLRFVLDGNDRRPKRYCGVTFCMHDVPFLSECCPVEGLCVENPGSDPNQIGLARLDLTKRWSRPSLFQ